ncbi:DUF2971 domain-containing protein [Cereibacter sphaeroides]|nr:DUF2971 domain-containing protein [Cereibacter sphaeroides]
MQEIFYPNYNKRVQKIRDNDRKFAHYTSAEVAVSILKNKSVWLRNASVMNDFNEIEHGLNCLLKVLDSDTVGKQFANLVNEIHPTAFNSIMIRYAMPTDLHDTYLTCLSEHGPNGGAISEDKLGRLSMWRAYGGNTNVAMVFDREKVLNDHSTATTLSPVLYADAFMFRREFMEVMESIAENIELLKGNKDLSLAYLFGALDAAVLSTKHPGFEEEQEWRVIHRPTPYNKLPCMVASVGGVPQKVYLLNLDGANSALNLNDILDHIIVGPTAFPDVISDALIQVMTSEHYHNPQLRVKVSEIPLRR